MTQTTLLERRTKTFEQHMNRDLLIVDKSLEAVSGNIVVAMLNGEFTVKRLYLHQETLILCAENEDYADIKVTKYDDFEIWGVVTNVIHSV